MDWGDLEMDLETAILVAVESHAGQTDKAGRPYILHPLRVMMAVVATGAADWISSVAVLHDVVEDTDMTLQDLKDADLSERQAEVLDLLTHKPDQTRKEYIEAAAAHPIARAIKRNDVGDNYARLGQLPAHLSIRLRDKYDYYLRVLNAADWN